MKKISVFTLLLTLIAGGVFAQTPRTLYNRTNNNSWNNKATWQDSATNQQASSIPTEYDTVYIGRANKEVTIGGIVAKASKVIVQNNYLKIDNNKASLTCDSLIFESSNTNNEIKKGTVTGTVVCRNGGYVKLSDGKSKIVGNVIVENGTLDLKHDNAVVDGSITVGNGGTLNFSNETAVTGDIILKNGANYDLTKLQEGEFGANESGGTLIFEAGAVIDETKLPDFLQPSSNPTNVMCIKPIQRGWNFIGLPLSSDIAPLAAEGAPAMWALAFNYTVNNWDENYLHYVPDDPQHQSTLEVGNGIFVFLEDNSYNINLGYDTGETDIVTMTYPYTGERSAQNVGRWFALANPYMKNLDISTFVSANPNKIQGVGVYLFDGTSFGTIQASGTIPVGDGFFVNMADGQSDITFNYPSTANSKSAEREFVRVSVATNGYKVPVMFAQNDDASDGYDIYDANKMFGDGSVAEPYLVCNGINLCKEEVSSTNYTATMNIKSFESRSVEIVADNIPEGYSLTLLDGAVEVEMSEGDVYTTDITEGENAERFKLLINKNNVSIADVAEVESVRVVNNNRSIAIYGGKNVRTEVYNALGQKVYETSDRVFDLNNVASGAYVLRVQDGKSVNSTKIVVE